MSEKLIPGAVSSPTPPANPGLHSREFEAICRRDADREAFQARSRARRARRDALSGKRGFGGER